MGNIENQGKIKVSRAYKKFITTALGAFAKGLKFTSDPDCVAPPSDDLANKGLADTMLNTNSQRLTNPSKTLTSLERKEKNALKDALDADANYVETVANAVAKSAGDVNAGISVVTRIGFSVAGKGTAKRNIGFVDCGPGWAHAHEAKSRKGFEAHIWDSGLTTAKGTPPTSTLTTVTCEADCIFNNLTSGVILAYHHGSAAPVAQKSKTTSTSLTPQSQSAKTSSLMPMTKSKHPVIDFNNRNNIQFGEWRYIVIP